MISLAGSTFAIAQGSIWLPWKWLLWIVKVVLLRQLRLAVQLHGIKTVVIVHHSNCGAYAAYYCFSSKQEEKARQRADMEKAKKILQKRFPGLIIKLVWAELHNQQGEDVSFSLID
jgi:hypothetical protein